MNKPPRKNFLPEGFEVEQDLLDQISSRSATQRLIEGEVELLMVVHEVPETGVPERVPMVFWRKADETWVGPDLKPGLAMLSRLLARYQDTVDENEALVEEAETAGDVFKVARYAGPLARSIRNLATTLEQAVTHDEDNRRLIGLRDRSKEIERAAELLYHDAKLTLDFMHAERSEEQQEATERLNVIAFRLNLMAGFFLPLVAMGGLLGMNVDIPDFIESWFWLILCGGMVVGGVLLWIVGRKRFTKDR